MPTVAASFNKGTMQKREREKLAGGGATKEGGLRWITGLQNPQLQVTA
jgi:hypothetical protein